jgi:hypothetical protein
MGERFSPQNLGIGFKPMSAASHLMKFHPCLACGMEKGLCVLECSAYAEEDGHINEPIDPLIEVDFEPANIDEFFGRRQVTESGPQKSGQPDKWILCSLGP